jgi:hypothetical protein
MIRKQRLIPNRFHLARRRSEYYLLLEGKTDVIWATALNPSNSDLRGLSKAYCHTEDTHHLWRAELEPGTIEEFAIYVRPNWKTMDVYISGPGGGNTVRVQLTANPVYESGPDKARRQEEFEATMKAGQWKRILVMDMWIYEASLPASDLAGDIV